MRESESAMFIVEHNIKRATEISDKLLQVSQGKLVEYELEALSEE